MNYTPERKTVLLWQIRAGVAAFLPAALFLLLFGVNTRYLLPCSLFAAVVCATAFAFIPLYFKKYSVFVGENAIVVEKGVLVRTSRIMPFKRLVFAAGYQTPLARIMGLKGVKLRAARADLFIPELEISAANRLIYGISGEPGND